MASTSDEALRGADGAGRLTGKMWFMKNSNLADYMEVSDVLSGGLDE